MFLNRMHSINKADARKSLNFFAFYVHQLHLLGNTS